MTPLPLTPEQVRTLQETGILETWDEMDPQPVRDPTFLGGWVWKTEAHSTSVQSLVDGLYPEHHPHPIGTRANVPSGLMFGLNLYSPRFQVFTAIISTAVRVERREGVWGFVTSWRRA